MSVYRTIDFLFVFYFRLKYDVEDLQKSLADTKLDNDRLTKELAEQKDIVCFRYIKYCH